MIDKSQINKAKKILILFIFCLSISVLIFPAFVKAEDMGEWVTSETYGGPGGGMNILVRSMATDEILVGQTAKEWLIYLKEHSWNVLQKAWEKSGNQAIYSALSSAANTIAYDTATWLGSGGKGQKPMFITEGWGTYLTNVTDNAAGTFIETLGKNGPTQFNLCKPDFSVNLRIGLGLIQYAKPKKPACTFSEMKKNWEKELQSKDFLNKFQDMFNPASNDLGIALTLQTGMAQQAAFQEGNAEKKRTESGGWLDVESLISGNKESPPEEAPEALKQVRSIQTGKLLKSYSDPFIEAANIFLNQLALTLFNETIKKLGQNKPTYTSPYNWDSLTNPNASPGSGGIAGAKEQLRKIVEPKFNVRGDYNILGELTQCPNPTKAGPTNCVIDEKFRQAIENKVSVGEAVKNGYLKTNGVFGYNSSGLEPNYLEGYPYRSMAILRKFRILPVGWELAAQQIADNLNSIKTKNLGDLVACFDPNDEYKGYNDNGSQGWCLGLVDPKWVLKAPLNYCRREGPGPEIISSVVSGAGSDSQLTVTRNDKYCADEQSCIKENDDGSCQNYGYCIEDRRKWRFDSKACEPRYNTCQTFKVSDPTTGQAGGNTASYLENTLDYSGCSVDNAGCLAYCTDYNYATGNFSCTNISVGDKIYLDNGAEACDAKNEGCHEFVRTKIGLGANLLLNSSFEEDLSVGNWSALSTATSTTSYDGLNSLELSSGLGTKVVAVAPAGYDIGNINGDVFTLSFYSNGCGAGSTYKLDASQPGLFDIATSTGWQFNQAKYVVPQTVYGNQLTLNFNSAGAGCLIDALKLERGYRATAYNNYQSNEKVYEKLIPGYLQPQCYDALGNLLPTAPAECGSFARMCRQEEVGCELFTSTEDKMAVPAKVGAQNYCVPECVNFKSYLATETYFDSSRQENFIPKTAKSCSAAVVGCDEFTNLDKVAAGGEAIENYSYLRQCVKPAASGASCGEFYTWEGSNESGFQLRVVSLDSIATAGTPDPRVTDPTTDANNCNETIYNLAPTDPAYNADCREFYNTSGLKFYHLYTLTVSCDEDCHPYRRTEVNIDTSLGFGDCSGADRNWADHNGDTIPECALCKNGGNWSAEHNACIYNAIPSQGRICQASAAGCREYTGSSGRNIRVVLNNDFEDGTQQNWTGASLSNESIIVGGRSLSVSSASDLINKDVSTIVQEDKSYILSFIAKSNGASSLSARFENSAASSSVFGTVTGLIGDWQIYELNLARLDHQVDAGEKLVIVGSGGTGDFYIDNIKLTEIVNRYYLIKNSWNTPAVCNADLSGNPFPNYMLGCEEYTDRDRQTNYLKSFAYLCSESAVGCEMMIDTMNSSNPAASDPAAGEFNYSNDNILDPPTLLDNKDVQADAYIYAVYDKKKQCNSDDKGCQRLGKPYSYASSTLYSDLYLKNDPDKYATAMCTYDATFCGEYSTADGLSYFKNPGDQVCEWRQAVGSQGWGWYKKKIKRCTTSGDICLKNTNCLTPETCEQETTDNPCDTEILAGIPPKSFGFGGGSKIEQPDNNWAGLCPAEYAGCSELIDPASSFSVNLIFNSDFLQNLNTTDDPARDGWFANAQKVRIEQNTLYRLAGTDSILGNNLSIACNNALYLLDTTSNRLIFSGPTIAFTLEAQEKSLLFYSGDSNSCTINITVINVGNTKVELKKAVLDYQLKQKLNKTDCNGVVNFEDGCVLFNQRSQNGGALSGLIYDVDTSIGTPNSSAPASENDSNVLLKVEPDRVCDKWLACKTKVAIKNEANKEENLCLDIGICTSLDENGNCDSFINKNKINQTFPTAISAGTAANYSGYSKIGFSPNDYYPLGAMSQEGESTQINNGSFEIAGLNGYPLSWSVRGTNIVWDQNVFKVVNNPYAAQKEGVGNSPDGKGFVKLGADYSIESEYIDVNQSTQYFVSALANTINLSSGSARLQIYQYNSNNEPIGIVEEISLPAGKNWQTIIKSFVTGSATNKLKVVLSATGASIGNVYFDNIKIAAVLNSKNNWYTPQSCRLYPEDSAMSCDYSDDSGIRQKGWPGYCLEYDRYPGSADACILWWPIDRVSGESVNDPSGYGGYNGKYPVYYCDNIDANFEIVETRQNVFLRSETKSSWTIAGWVVGGILGGFTGVSIMALTQPGNSQTGAALNQCPQDSPAIPNGGYIITTTQSSGGNWLKKKVTTNYYCTPNSTPVVTASGITWYPYNGNLVKFSGFDETKKGVMLYDLTTGQLIKPEEYQIKCGKVHQTVNASGQNKAWTGRVYPASTYQANQLGYKYGDDSAPFGSMVPPSPVHNPYEWDGSSFDGNNPVPLLPKKSNEVRAGSPYSCVGSGCNDLGLCSLSNDVCLYVLNNGPNSSSTNPIYNVINSCEMNDTAPCYSNWQQNILSCPSGEICDVNKYNLETVTTPPAENLRRLFAKSYGTWDWSGTTGACANNPAITCTNDTNQCPGGTCAARCQMNYQGRRVYNAGSPPPVYANCNIGDSCSGIIFGGRTEAQWNATNTCAVFSSVCGPGGLLCVASRCCDMPGTGSCIIGDEEECCASNGSQTAQQVYDECVNFYTVAPPARVCTVTGDACTSNPDCQFDARCEYDTCSGGTQNLNNCMAAQTCAGSYCILSNTNSGRYTPVVGQTWDVPIIRCVTTPRPAAFTVGDYCAVPPVISNVMVNGIVSNTTIFTSGLAKLTFNSDVEENQLPLVMYEVDWRDGDVSSINGMEMFDRADPANPHSLYHIYNYWDLMSRAGMPGTSINCSVAGECRVKPRVKIKDNWGWCNDGINEATGAAETSTAPGDCNQVVPFDAEVVVREN